MFKKLILLLILLLMVTSSQAQITDLQGITGKIGKEDVYWGTGQSTDTFTVPTYEGSTTTLTKVPNLDTTTASQIKGVWYVAKISGDHGSAALTGSLAWILTQITTTKTTIEFPGNQSYQISTNTTIPSTITLKFQHGAVITVDPGKILTINGTIEAPDNQIFTGTGTVTGALTNAVKNNIWFSGTVTDTTTASGTLKKINAITSIDSITTVTNFGTLSTLGEVTNLSKIGTANAQGDIYYHNGTKVANLPAGTAGNVLQTNGPGANPNWQNPTSITLPPGLILPYGGSSAPALFLMCDGAEINRTTYAALFAIIGTTFGVGNGSTTFNVPDLRGRFPLGKATAGTGSTLGITGGSIDHTHSVPSHNHALGGAVQMASGGFNVNDYTTTTSSSDVLTSGTSNPPFQVVNYIIKY